MIVVIIVILAARFGNAVTGVHHKRHNEDKEGTRRLRAPFVTFVLFVVNLGAAKQLTTGLL